MIISLQLKLIGNLQIEIKLVWILKCHVCFFDGYLYFELLARASTPISSNSNAFGIWYFVAPGLNLDFRHYLTECIIFQRIRQDASIGYRLGLVLLSVLKLHQGELTTHHQLLWSLRNETRSSKTTFPDIVVTHY